MYCEAFSIGMLTKKVDAYMEYTYVVQQIKCSSTAFGNYKNHKHKLKISISKSLAFDFMYEIKLKGNKDTLLVLMWSLVQHSVY